MNLERTAELRRGPKPLLLNQIAIRRNNGHRGNPPTDVTSNSERLTDGIVSKERAETAVPYASLAQYSDRDFSASSKRQDRCQYRGVIRVSAAESGRALCRSNRADEVGALIARTMNKPAKTQRRAKSR